MVTKVARVYVVVPFVLELLLITALLLLHISVCCDESQAHVECVALDSLRDKDTHIRARRNQIVRTTLPKGRLSSRYLRASAASAKGKVLATVGLMAPESSSGIRAFQASSQSTCG